MFLAQDRVYEHTQFCPFRFRQFLAQRKHRCLIRKLFKNFQALFGVIFYSILKLLIFVQKLTYSFSETMFKASNMSQALSYSSICKQIRRRHTEHSMGFGHQTGSLTINIRISLLKKRRTTTQVNTQHKK